MPQDILCPQCNKKFRVGDRPPATYNCTKCGLLMDLTPFGGADRKKPAAAPAGPTPSRGPARRRPARGGTRRRGPPSREAYDDGYDERDYRRRPQSNNSALIISIVAVVVLAVVIIVATSSDDEPPPRVVKKTEVEEPTDDMPFAPELTGDDTGSVPKTARKPRKKRKPRLGRIELQAFAWPEEVDASTRQRVEASIQDLYRGGRDSTEAKDWLVAQGRPICGRLISEFKSINKSPGFDNREGASMAMTIDGTLREIDGWIERFWEEEQRIRAWGVGASPDFIRRIAKRWIYWWLEDVWKDEPREPWDPMVDAKDALEGDALEGEGTEKKPEKKPGGFTKRAGDD